MSQSYESTWWERVEGAPMYSSGKLFELEDAVRQAVASGRDYSGSSLINEAHLTPAIDDDETCDEEHRALFEEEDAYHLTKYVESPYFEAYSNAAVSRVGRAWYGRSNMWHYGTRNETESLLPGETSLVTRRVGRLGRYVTSGLVGADILLQDDRLRAVARSAEDNPLRRAILVGSIAATLETGDRQRPRYEDGTHYELPVPYGRASTFVGADMHGDFRTRRTVATTHFVAESASGGEGYAYAPVIESGEARAYHSAEPHVTRALLEYLVNYKEAHPGELRDRLYEQITARLGSDASSSGLFAHPFADYGESDGSRARHDLVYALRDKEKDQEPSVVGRELARYVVWPQHEEVMRIVAMEDGVAFHNSREESEQEMRYMPLPADEIEPYIVALAMGRGGRTSSSAIVQVINGLSDV